MNYNKKDIIELNDCKYMVMSVIFHEDIKYLFTNQIDEHDEPKNSFNIFYQNKDGALDALTDAKIANILIPKFQEDLKVAIKNELES